MIHLLLPSRGRPGNVQRLYDSLIATTTGEWRMIVYLDNDDPTEGDYPRFDAITYLFGDRMLLSAYWNACYGYAIDWGSRAGDVFMHAGDDITFRTLGWDEIVKAAFPEDGIAFVHGDDLSVNARTLGTHGFLRREWIDALGYFVPPYFSSDFNDAWLNEVANLLDRRVYVPIITEHHHPAFGKAEWDLTHRERIERHHADDTTAIWWAHAADRYLDAAKLRARMSNP